MSLEQQKWCPPRFNWRIILWWGFFFSFFPKAFGDAAVLSVLWLCRACSVWTEIGQTQRWINSEHSAIQLLTPCCGWMAVLAWCLHVLQRVWLEMLPANNAPIAALSRRTWINSIDLRMHGFPFWALSLLTYFSDLFFKAAGPVRAFLCLCLASAFLLLGQNWGGVVSVSHHVCGMMGQPGYCHWCNWVETVDLEK